MCKQWLKPGVRVKMATPYFEGGLSYEEGIIRNSLDGEYWYIRVPVMADETALVERYFTDLRIA